MSRRNLPRDANITAAANVGKSPHGLNSKLTIEGILAGPPQSEDTKWDALAAIDKRVKRGVITLDQARLDILALGLDSLHKPKPTAPPAPTGPTSVACPDCGSVPKKRCRSQNGIERGQVHIARRRLAEQHTEEAA